VNWSQTSGILSLAASAANAAEWQGHKRGHGNVNKHSFSIFFWNDTCFSIMTDALSHDRAIIRKWYLQFIHFFFKLNKFSALREIFSININTTN